MSPSPNPSRIDPAQPAVDDHIVPEGARWELLNGERILSPPSKEPHATRHTDLAYVLRAHVASGWRVAVDMLTRADHGDDFAPDLSIYPEARDPQTGGRQLEALAFEIVSQQSVTVPTKKAAVLAQRGVRRIFAIKLRKKGTTVMEFEPNSGTWLTLTPAASIADPCLAIPITVHDLLDAALADAAVARALLARNVPEIMAPIHHALQRADEEHQRAEAAEAERELERQRADAERQRAEAAEAERELERQRAEAAEAERDALARQVAALLAERDPEGGG